jgi:GT2 family glycosyltransferase
MIHIIIPVHNRLSYSKNCLESIFLNVKIEKTITIVDAGSTDGTSNFLRDKYPQVNIVNVDESHFWTGSIKAGVENVLKFAKEFDFIMSLNNDVIVPVGSIEALLNEAKNDRKNLYGSLSLSIKDKDTIVSSATIIKSWIFNLNSHLYRYQLYSNMSDFSPKDADILTGRSVLYPIEIFSKIGNFDSKRFPHYGGDDEFTFRAKRMGWGLKLVPKSVVYIDQKATGLNPKARVLSVKNLVTSIFSLRSTNNLAVRTRLGIMIAPWYAVPTYLLASYTKVFLTIIIGLYYLIFGNKK